MLLLIKAQCLRYSRCWQFIIQHHRTEELISVFSFCEVIPPPPHWWDQGGTSERSPAPVTTACSSDSSGTPAVDPQPTADAGQKRELRAIAGLFLALLHGGRQPRGQPDRLELPTVRKFVRNTLLRIFLL